MGPLEFFENENFEAGAPASALKFWNWTSKIIPDLWLLDLFCLIKKKFYTPPYCVWVEERRHLHQVQNSPDTLLAESSDHVVELCLLTDDAVGAEAGLCQGEPAGGRVAPEGQDLDVSEAWGLVELDEVLLVLGHGENPRTVYLYKKKLKIITTN